jgi:transposase
LTFVHKLIKQFRDTGAIEPMPHAGGKERKINSTLMEALIEETNANPSATLDHLRSFLSSRFGVTVSNATIFRALRREGSRKNRTQARKAVGRTRKASA